MKNKILAALALFISMFCFSQSVYGTDFCTVWSSQIWCHLYIEFDWSIQINWWALTTPSEYVYIDIVWAEAMSHYWFIWADIRNVSSSESCETWVLSEETAVSFANRYYWSLASWNWAKHVCLRAFTENWLYTTRSKANITLSSWFYVWYFSPSSWFQNEESRTIDIFWWWFSNIRANWEVNAFTYEVVWVDWKVYPLTAWILWRISNTRLTWLFDFEAIDNALTEIWEPEIYPRRFDIRITDLDWNYFQTNWKRLAILEIDSDWWIIEWESLRFEDSRTVYQILVENWLLNEVPSFANCKNSWETYVIKIDHYVWCFQVWWVINTAFYWNAARVIWNCPVTDIDPGPIWIFNWETDETLLKEKLYDSKKCSAD